MCKKIEILNDMVFAKESNENAFKLFDSNKRTKWVGGQFPCYVDIRLRKMFDISRVVLDCPKDDICLFSVFASVDGVNFTEVLTQTSEKNCGGHYEFVCNFEACSLRFLFKYARKTSYATVRSIELFGEESKNEPKKADVVFPEDFEKSEYNIEITKEDT